MEIEGALTYTYFLGNILNGQLAIALAGEQPLSGIQNRLSNLFFSDYCGHFACLTVDQNRILVTLNAERAAKFRLFWEAAPRRVVSYLYRGGTPWPPHVWIQGRPRRDAN